MACASFAELRERRGALVVSSFSAMMLNLIFSVTGPFLAQHAEEHWHASSFQVSALFAGSTLATMIFCPICASLCKRFGRNTICLGGLFGMAATTFVFGFVTEIYSGILVRFVQGISGAMVAVASLALLAQQSQDLSEDLAIKEFFTGQGLIVGPIIGGVAYQYCGFLWTNVIQALLAVLALGVALLILPPEQEGWVAACRGSHRKKEAKYAALNADDGGPAEDALADGEDPSADCQARAPSVLTLVVIVCTSCVALSYMTLAFLGPTLAKHLERSLEVDSAGSGILLSTGAISNVFLGCPLAMLLSRPHRLGAKGTLIAGLASLSVGFVLLPGAPFTFSPSGYPRVLSWVCSVAGMALIGVGVSFEMVPTLPAMRASLGPHGPLADDTLSSMFFCALTAGATLGPVLSSVLEKLVPETDAPSCTDDDCGSPFAFSALVLSVFLLCTTLVAYFLLPSTLPMTLEQPDLSEETESEGTESGWLGEPLLEPAERAPEGG
mmetsp:Transcript_12183/g.45206  ORF Transcript_12183/g.45206 Transcript_12183/m.45206 type:complete len:497 (-) Transcript_12183:29-1519(-)